MRTDRRMRMGGMRMVTNRFKTVCGAAATEHDIDRSGLAHYVACVAVRPDWLAGVCPDCRLIIDAKAAP